MIMDSPIWGIGWGTYHQHQSILRFKLLPTHTFDVRYLLKNFVIKVGNQKDWRNDPLISTINNTAYECFIERLRTELFYPRNWKGFNVNQFILIVNANISWYNEKCIKNTLGLLSNIEYRTSREITA